MLSCRSSRIFNSKEKLASAAFWNAPDTFTLPNYFQHHFRSLEHDMSDAKTQTHTPAPSQSNITVPVPQQAPVAVVGGLDHAGAVHSGGQPNPSIPVSLGTIWIPIECHVHCGSLTGDAHGKGWDLRSHPNVEFLLRMAAAVNLVSISIFVYQAKVVPIGTGFKPRHIRFGVGPSKLTVHSTVPGKGKDDKFVESTVNRVGFLPSMVDFVTSCTIATSARASWGKGKDFPFPPGLQLDLRDAETRFTYPAVYLAQTSPDSDSEAVVSCQISFVVLPSGAGNQNPFQVVL